MGIDIDKTTFDEVEYSEFSQRLADNLAGLETLLARPGFGESAGSVGSELEIYIVDAQGRPLHRNEEILAIAHDSQLTLELNRYNLEYNLLPYRLGERPFECTEREILEKLATAGELAASFDGRVVATGILPTLTKDDFGRHSMTNRKRYQALVSQLVQRRGGDFNIDINGAEPLRLAMADITLEGANTSFQVHYRVNPEDYADTFNAFQLMTPVALALAANSPTLFGHRLWQETRIPLFKQSIDTRHTDRYSWQEPARVNFGNGWVRRGALELFAEVAHLYPPLLPLCSVESAEQQLARGQVPGLDELRLHQSTVWLWNRPIYDDADGGQLRVEMRALPAGPTALDMVANAAFLIGLAEGIRPRINELLPGLPFPMAEYNFYRAAQYGLQARLLWPSPKQSGCAEQSVTTLVEELLPLARDGLLSIGISAQEISRYLDVIAGRLAVGRNGADWQLATLAQLESKLSRREALQAMLEKYMVYSTENRPVAEWPL